MARASLDQVEQPRRRFAQVEAPPAGMADVKDARHLRLSFRPIGKIGILPRDRVPGRSVEAAFPDHLSLIVRIACLRDIKGRGAEPALRPPDVSPAPLMRSQSRRDRDFRRGGPAPAGSGRHQTFRPWPGFRTTRRFPRSPLRAVRAIPGCMSVYSRVSPATAAARLPAVGLIGLPVTGSPTSSRYSR